MQRPSQSPAVSRDGHGGRCGVLKAYRILKVRCQGVLKIHPLMVCVSQGDNTKGSGHSTLHSVTCGARSSMLPLASRRAGRAPVRTYLRLGQPLPPVGCQRPQGAPVQRCACSHTQTGRCIRTLESHLPQALAAAYAEASVRVLLLVRPWDTSSWSFQAAAPQAN
jgi:hypothetical protein